MARRTKPTPENNWHLSDEQVQAIRSAYVDEQCTLQRAAYRTGVKESVVAMVCKHHGWTRSCWDRPRHPWMKEAAVAVAAREARSDR